MTTQPAVLNRHQNTYSYFFCIIIVKFLTYSYKVPLREMPMGVAQERNNEARERREIIFPWERKPLHTRSDSDTWVGCLVSSFFCVCVGLCVIHKKNEFHLSPRRSTHTPPNKSSPRRFFCACKQTQDTFSPWWGGEAVIVGRAMCGNVCRHNMSVPGRVQKKNRNSF